MKDKKSNASVSVDNIYKLDGRVPVAKAIPFGLQHVLAMFVANVTPVMLIASVAVYNGVAFTAIDTALLIQAAMLVAGIGTLIQLYPIWRIGSRLPVVMGLSFTFLSAMMTLAARDYGLMIGAVIVGGCIEGLLGLTAKYWRRFVSPIVSACVVTTIGFSLLSTGISSFASSSVYPTGAWQNLLVAVITLAACLIYNSLAKGFWKQLYVLFGLIVGYIVSLFFGMVDFASMKNTVQELGIIALPKLFAYTPKFEIGAIVSVTLVFLVSAAETIGDTSAVCTGGLGREITEKEVSGSLGCDGFHFRNLRRRVRLPAHYVLQPERGFSRDDEGRQPLYDHVWRPDAHPCRPLSAGRCVLLDASRLRAWRLHGHHVRRDYRLGCHDARRVRL